jgi:hypothetical protein
MGGWEVADYRILALGGWPARAKTPTHTDPD